MKEEDSRSGCLSPTTCHLLFTVLSTPHPARYSKALVFNISVTKVNTTVTLSLFPVDMAAALKIPYSSSMKCNCCGEIGRYMCSRCSKAWYCSKSCQVSVLYRHKFDCDPPTITTADRLVLACMEDFMPRDFQTLQDYGFHRASTHENQTMLLGLYQGLTKYLSVEANALNRWRKKGILVQQIKKHFDEIPVKSRGGYYPWFLKNQWVLDGKVVGERLGKEQMFNLAWTYAGGSPNTPFPEIQRKVAEWEEPKFVCFILCSLLMSDIIPGPNDPQTYIHFGFCTCDDWYEEMKLARMYTSLLLKDTFDELVNAYKSSSVHFLLHSKFTAPDQSTPDLLEGVLSASPKKILPVWYLKQFVLKGPEGRVGPNSFDLPDRLDVNVDYGFRNCTNKSEFEALKAAYKLFFDHPDIHRNVLELHKACLEGNLYEYLSGIINLGKNDILKRLMQNPYPVRDGADLPNPSLQDGYDAPVGDEDLYGSNCSVC